MTYPSPTRLEFLLRVEYCSPLEYTMVVNQALFEEDGVFRFFVNAPQVNVSNNLMYSSVHHANTCWAWLCLLTTCAHKCMRLQEFITIINQSLQYSLVLHAISHYFKKIWEDSRFLSFISSLFKYHLQ